MSAKPGTPLTRNATIYELTDDERACMKRLIDAGLVVTARSDKFKGCGCLTDGYNWLPECKEHESVRRERARLLVALDNVLVDGSEDLARRNRAEGRALLKELGA